MIKGKPTEERLSPDEVLSRTSGGYDIYMLYIGKVARVLQRPWGKKESKLSWGIFPSNGIWKWKDQATEEYGNAIQFVQKMFNLDFPKAMKKIIDDFNLNYTGSSPKSIITWTPPEAYEKEYLPIDIIDQPFKSKHHKFWNAAEVTEAHCNKYNTYAVKSLAINKQRVNLRKDEIVFAYYSPEEEGYKIYFPEREKKNRFRNNISYHYLWNFSNVQECEKLIVQKSMKDLLVTTLLTPCCIATQAEAIKIFNEEVINSIESITENPWIWYGSDWDGVKKCKSITELTKWKYINTPKNLLPDINDTYSFAKKFDLKTLESFMKRKKLL